MAQLTQNYKVSAKDATTVTLIPSVDGDKSVQECGRAITQIVITSTALADHTTEKFFSEVNRVIGLELKRKSIEGTI